MSDRVNAFHNTIAFEAAKIANEHPDLPPLGFIFKPVAVASTKTAEGIDGLCLEWDAEGYLYRLSQEDQQWAVYFMESIGREAIRKAIVDNKEAFVSVIINEAKEGRNYFDFFNNDTTMDTLG